MEGLIQIPYFYLVNVALTLFFTRSALKYCGALSFLFLLQFQYATHNTGWPLPQVLRYIFTSTILTLGGAIKAGHVILFAMQDFFPN
jgi:hypothetical protein